jgi:hypothetical protein
MTEKPSGIWKWLLLLVGLAVVHVLIVTLVEAFFLPPRFYRIRMGLYQKPWLYYTLINVFLFPASVIVRFTRPDPQSICIWLFGPHRDVSVLGRHLG